MSKRTIKPKRPAKSREDADFDISDSESHASSLESDFDADVDAIDHDLSYHVASANNVSLQLLNEFLGNQNYINDKQNPTTNIIDRQMGICYCIPEMRLPKFFHLLEKCRRESIHVMFTEKQNKESSGIMLDFDIYQDDDKEQITNFILNDLVTKVVDLLTKIITINEKKTQIIVGITRKPKIEYSDSKKCFKDGLHLIIPGVKVQTGVKKLLIKKLIKNELLEQIFADVQPATMKINGVDYERKDFIDEASSYVPTFFIGNPSKKGCPAYKLTHVFCVEYNSDTKSCVTLIDDKFLKRKSINRCYEFSLNFTVPGGVISKQHYDLNPKYIDEVEAFYLDKQRVADEDAQRNFGRMSTLTCYDAQTEEIKSLLDILNPKRADDYSDWRNVIFVLANESSSYKELAEYFSRKSKKFSMVDFTRMWEQAVNTSTRGKKPLSIGSLHYWAKQDNPDRYEEARKNSADGILSEMVREAYRDGRLSHSDVALLLHKLLKQKFIVDIPEGEKKPVWYEFILDEDYHIDGELYKWHSWGDINPPKTLSFYMSSVLPKLFQKTLERLIRNRDSSTDQYAKHRAKIVDNFKATMRQLGDRNFIANAIKIAEDRFYRRGFADTLDKDPLIRGVANGVLKLSHAYGGRPQLITGRHNLAVSRYTKVPYIAFNPFDPITKKLLIVLRNLFPDDEPDSFEFTMSYLASTVDGKPKTSMFMLVPGSGANGKSFLVEIHRGAIGESYCVKVPLASLTQKTTSGDTATPALMMLKGSTLATYSESNKHEKLNTARIKEMTGMETLAGRRLHQDIINFKPTCHHLVTTNHDFDIDSTDHGTWRRITYNPMKIKFVDVRDASQKYDPNNPLERIADPTVQEEWTQDPEIQGRYLGIMVWYNYWLYRKYSGRLRSIPHPHIQFETEKYRSRQDVMNLFLSQKFCALADDAEERPLASELSKYVSWYSFTQGTQIPTKGLSEAFQNSKIGKYIRMTNRGPYLVGHKFLSGDEMPSEGESFAFPGLAEQIPPEDNFGIKSENAIQYYERICTEYTKYKAIFDDSPQYDVDIDQLDDYHVIAGYNNPTMNAYINDYKAPRKDNIYEDDNQNTGHVLPSGIILKYYDEPSKNLLTNTYYIEAEKFIDFDPNEEVCINNYISDEDDI